MLMLKFHTEAYRIYWRQQEALCTFFKSNNMIERIAPRFTNLKILFGVNAHEARGSCP
jgi:hypothetical protein